MVDSATWKDWEQTLCGSGSFSDSRHLRTSSIIHRDHPLAHFENKEVSTFLHFPIGHLSQGNLDLKLSTLQEAGPWSIILNMPIQSVQESSIPELRTAWICQISGSNWNFTKILRKTTNVSSPPIKNWPKTSTRVQECDLPSYGFLTHANTC
jgi:hypothetical protein